MCDRDPGAQSLSWPERGVACVWLPRLPIRVEILRHPYWDGRPVVLGGGPGERKVVQHCSLEAEQAGVRPGVPLREVRSRCSDAIIRQSSPVLASTVLDELAGKLRQVSPAVEAADEQLFLDLRGLQRLYQHSLLRLERAIRAVIPPVLHPRISIAPGKLVAAIAARQAPASGLLSVADGETVRFLAPLPIGVLPLAPEMLKRLERLGLRTVADVAALSFSAVQAEFGPAGAQAWRLAHGQDSATIVPRSVIPTVQASLRFDHSLASTDAILAALNILLARAFGDSNLRGRSARQARLRGLLTNGTVWERLITFKEAVSSKQVAYEALKSKLQLPRALPEAAFDELSLMLLGLGGEAAKQPGLFSARARQHAEIVEAMRQLRARYGSSPLYRAMEVEPWSRIPERRWALIPDEP